MAKRSPSRGYNSRPRSSRPKSGGRTRRGPYDDMMGEVAGGPAAAIGRRFISDGGVPQPPPGSAAERFKDFLQGSGMMGTIGGFTMGPNGKPQSMGKGNRAFYNKLMGGSTADSSRRKGM